MKPKELVARMKEYVDSGDDDPEAYVFNRLIELHTDGYAEFALEEGGKLIVTYDDGNSPVVRLTENAELDFRLIQYIALWLEYQWQSTPAQTLRPYRIGSNVILRKKRLPLRYQTFY